MIDFVKKFDELTKHDVSIAGGKGASLGEMTQAGIPVPPGFVVLSRAFDQFLKETDLNVEIDAILHKVNTEEVHTVEAASEEIQALIMNAETPEDILDEVKKEFKKLGASLVAVRSSATSEDSASAAWAGQLDSFLNTTEANLLENIKKCWASLFTPRAIFYRFETFGRSPKSRTNADGTQTHADEKISVAVVVQKMIQSEVSGIAFSVHPVTQDRNQLIIEAALGLGEAIVSGQITPDSYVVEKEPRRILDKNIFTQERGLFKKERGSSASSGQANEWQDIPQEQGEKQVLSDEQILELSELIIKIEQHYGFPVDVEFAREKGKFYIVQSRPITTLRGDKNFSEIDTFSSINLKNFKKLFELSSMPFLVNDILLANYKSFGILFFYDSNGNWESYMSNEGIKSASQKGKDFFNSNDLILNWERSFTKYINTSPKEFKKILARKKNSKKDVQKYFEIILKLHSFYIKTEFFFTDKAYFTFKDINKRDSLELLISKWKQEGREYLNKIFFGEESYLNCFINLVGKQFNISAIDLYNFTQQEIEDLFDGKIVSSEVLKERSCAYVTFSKKSENFIVQGKKAQEIIYKFKKTEIYNDKTKELKGHAVFGGKVIGIARVKLQGYDQLSERFNKFIKNFKKGEILITDTTSPRIIAVCSKAGAIVTNQGGILSHAAIIAREMKKPCIIGTKIATQVLKDGDLVEVDANEGVVRILERAG